MSRRRNKWREDREECPSSRRAEREREQCVSSSGNSGKESVRERGLKKQKHFLKGCGCLRSPRHGLHCQQSPREAQQGLPSSPQKETQEGLCVRLCMCAYVCCCSLLCPHCCSLVGAVTAWRSWACYSLITSQESCKMYSLL